MTITYKLYLELIFAGTIVLAILLINNIFLYKQKMEYIAKVLLLFAVCFLSAGCVSNEWVYDPITDVNDLEGRRVGVNLAWESDYYLTGRKDMELVRYDTTADMILALKYDKIDAIALDKDSIRLIVSVSDGIEIVEPSFGEAGSIMYFGSDNESLVEDFNQYLVEFKKTEEYQDLLKRMDEFNGSEYIGTDIPLTGKGEVIRLTLEPDMFPRAFINPGEDIPEGYDTEIIKHYANDRNYQLEFCYSSYDDSVLGLRTGKYDVMTGYICDLYAEEARKTGLLTCDSMYAFPMYFIQKNQKDLTSDTSEY